MIEDRTLVMVKVPSCLGANFRLEMRCFRFFTSSHILSPLEKGLKPHWEQEDITCLTSSWAARASFRAAKRVFRWVSTGIGNH